MTNIAALRVSMGNNIVAARLSMELFINPADSGAMHIQQSVRVSLLSSSSIIRPLFNDMPIKDGLLDSRFKIESPHKTDECNFLLQPQHERGESARFAPDGALL